MAQHYTCKIRAKTANGRPGTELGRIGRFAKKSDALKQAQVLADSGMVAGKQVTVEPLKVSSTAPGGGSRKNPRRKNPKTGCRDGSGEFLPTPQCRGMMLPKASAKSATHGGKRYSRAKAFTFKRFMGKIPKSVQNELNRARSAGQGAIARVAKTPSGCTWVVFTRGKAKAKAKTESRRKNPARGRGRRRSTAGQPKGGRIVGSRGNWRVEPYGKTFKTKAAAAKWLRDFVRSL